MTLDEKLKYMVFANYSKVYENIHGHRTVVVVSFNMRYTIKFQEARIEVQSRNCGEFWEPTPLNFAEISVDSFDDLKFLILTKQLLGGT